MTFEEYLKKRNITQYSLSKITGVPKSTINDICSGKSIIGNCSARTIKLLADGLGCSMEDIMELDSPIKLERETGKPLDKTYLECGLTPFLEESLQAMKRSWAIEDSGQRDNHWDIYWCDLNADINCAEVDRLISSEQVWYLREKYLRMKRETF